MIKARYISKYLSLRLINKSTYVKEIEGRRIVVSGSSVQFNEGIYETDDPEEIKFLDSHPNCGSIFIKVKDKDLRKAREKTFKSVEEKEAEEKAKEVAKIKKEKALEEGEGLPKKKGEESKSKKEKPAF